MEITNRSRRTGSTLAACLMMLPKLKEGEQVLIAGKTRPQNFISILNDLGVEVTVEQSFTTQRLVPVYDSISGIEPQIIGFTQQPKKLTGYIIKTI